ncbi:MAG: hypothetical protein ACHRXM_12195 [Isosphaerales bacterium]
MPIRSYQTSDEHAQARIYNAAAGSLPGFKPATAEEIGRRYQRTDPDAGSRYYATENGEVVGYALFGSNGRVSYPWCLPGSEAVREPLLDTVLAEMRKRRLPDAWAAYRGDWSPVLDFLRQHDFTEIRTMINYVADLSRLPSPDHRPSNRLIARLEPEDLPRLIALAPDLFRDVEARDLERFYWHDPFYNFSESLFAWKDGGSGEILGVYLLVVSDRFADPTKIDAAMPCFRLGTFGTERERHKRVNGLFSCVFADEAEGELILTTSAVTQATHSGLTHLAAQAPSDAVALCAWYDRFFQRQGSFPIWSRRLSS